MCRVYSNVPAAVPGLTATEQASRPLGQPPRQRPTPAQRMHMFKGSQNNRGRKRSPLCPNPSTRFSRCCTRHVQGRAGREAVGEEGWQAGRAPTRPPAETGHKKQLLFLLCLFRGGLRSSTQERGRCGHKKRFRARGLTRISEAKSASPPVSCLVYAAPQVQARAGPQRHTGPSAANSSPKPRTRHAAVTQ